MEHINNIIAEKNRKYPEILLHTFNETKFIIILLLTYRRRSIVFAAAYHRLPVVDAQVRIGPRMIALRLRSGRRSGAAARTRRRTHRPET